MDEKKLVIDIFRTKTADDFTKAIADPDGKLETGSAAADPAALAAAPVFDWQSVTQGKAGATLTATRDGVTITAKSKPLEVVAYRMRLYRDIPLLFGLFIRRQNGGGVGDH